MKKLLFTWVFLVAFLVNYAQPIIHALSFSSDAELFGLFEVSFSMNTYANPYDPEAIHVYADFVGPDSQSFTVDAFYYEGYDFKKDAENIEVAVPRPDDRGWKIRFTPNALGKWTFVLHAIDAQGVSHLNAFKGKPFAFQCKEVVSAKGFITKANTRFLKREVVTEGQRGEKSYFPIGINIAWYDVADHGRYAKPYGIYDYVKYIDAMSGNVNYMRIWLNRYQFLSIYGPEHTELENGRPRMYFDASLNQKDAAELDFILQYAKDHDVSVMPSIFNFGDFQHLKYVTPPTTANPAMPSDWINNPYHTLLGLDSPFQFFTDPEAIRITKNMIRYLVARYGHATNILCWEFWNEVSNILEGQPLDEPTQRIISDWHYEMASFLRSLDPYRHLISTSMGSVDKNKALYYSLFDNLDIVQYHNYQNIQKANSAEQFSAVLLKCSLESFGSFGYKPYFMGEFGFGQDKSECKYADKDPFGIDLHNSLWSSAFSCSIGPGSFWWWYYVTNKQLFVRFKPLLTFLSNLPVPSDSFRPETTGKVQNRTLVFPNHLETYYMINAAEDTIYGWSQDTAFAYQSLRHLTDPVGDDHHFVNGMVNDPQGYVYTLSSEKKPGASSSINTIEIPIYRQPVGTRYVIRWFDSETGLEIPSEVTTGVVTGNWFVPKELSFEFPISIRDPRTRSVNNTFGDAVFMITKVQ